MINQSYKGNHHDSDWLNFERGVMLFWSSVCPSVGQFLQQFTLLQALGTLAQFLLVWLYLVIFRLHGFCGGVTLNAKASNSL